MTASVSSAPANSTADLAAFVLRVTSGVLFLLHAGLKIFVFTPAGTAGFFQSIGLPGPLAYLVILIEVVGAIALIVGYKVRIVAPILAVLLLGTIVTVHYAAGFFFMNPNGGWEYPAFWAITLIATALLGDGAYSIGKKSA
ncbi:DoxX family protein [Tabrizicola sp. J26]|uniref:DoxX family protein n=1 Tax=Alitabrizicola rongguiensis TaxID=2909234 RepID=UPI001F45D98A|nr:DoxX family protein [Tabrizicola rongguiensis]MCF1709730.1 DoxX family protein [Tabrizicola rongguiensis]